MARRFPVLPLLLLVGVAAAFLLAVPHLASISTPEINIAEVHQQVQNEAIDFPPSVRRECIMRARDHDEITGDPLEIGYQLHHIRPKYRGGKGTLDNCVVVNLSTHRALHEMVDEFDIQKYYREAIPRLTVEGLRCVAKFLIMKGFTLTDGHWYAPWNPIIRPGR